MTMTFICPNCARVHQVNLDHPSIVMCNKCHRMYNLNPGRNTVRELSKFDSSSLFTRSKNPKVMLSQGASIPMVCNQDATKMVGDTAFYAIPDPRSLYSIRNLMQDRIIPEDKLSMLPEEMRTIDREEIINRVGSEAVAQLQIRYPGLQI